MFPREHFEVWALPCRIAIAAHPKCLGLQVQSLVKFHINKYSIKGGVLLHADIHGL